MVFAFRTDRCYNKKTYEGKNMRKKLLIFLSLLMLFGCLIAFQNLHDTSFIHLNQVSAAKAEKIRKNLRKTYQTDFTCLLCNDTRVPFDDETNTFYVPLDMNDGEWEKLIFSSGQQEYDILFCENIMEQDKQSVIAEGKKLLMIVYNEAAWAEYSVVFTGLPMIDLATAEGFYSENITGSAVFYNTDFSKNGVLTSDCNGHIRGNTSRIYPKKGYKLNLTKSTASGTTVNNKKSLFGMRKDDDWILYAMYNDETKLRDKLSIEVWNSFGAKAVAEKSTYGTNLTYIELVADNRYCGLYALMEPIDAKQLNLQAGDYLYKRKNPGGLDEKSFAAATDPLEQVQGFTVKEGVLDENAWKPMAELSRFLYQKAKELPTDGSVSVDEDSALRTWLFLQIITGHDQTAKNMFYAAKNTGNGYRFYFAPWDMDLTWGNVSVGEVNPLYTAYEAETFNDRVRWETADWLINSEKSGARKKVQELYASLRKDVLSDQSVKGIISETDRLIRNSGAYARDERRWPLAAHTKSSGQLEAYAMARLHFLDRALVNFDYFEKK